MFDRTAWNREYRHKIKRSIRELKDKPCADCGVKYPYYVMDFDHRPSEKKFKDVSDLLVSCRSLNRLKEEIVKCDVVCSNCHRIRTFERNMVTVPPASSFLPQP